MKTLKLYWLRFISRTPKALKKLQGLFAAMAVGIAAALAFMQQYSVDNPELFKLLTYAGVALAFSIPVLQFATTDKNLQNENTTQKNIQP